MNLAKISEATVPVEIRWQFGLKSGDKILFHQIQNREIVVATTPMRSYEKHRSSLPELLRH